MAKSFILSKEIQTYLLVSYLHTVLTYTVYVFHSNLSSSFVDGPDPVTASEARARGASPARSRAHHHHIHIQQQPGYIPSMTFRLNVTRELLSLANHLISRLENPNAPPSAVGNPREAAEVAVTAAIPTVPIVGAGRPMARGTGSEMGEAIPSQVAQAIQSAVNR